MENFISAEDARKKAKEYKDYTNSFEYNMNYIYDAIDKEASLGYTYLKMQEGKTSIKEVAAHLIVNGYKVDKLVNKSECSHTGGQLYIISW